ncbi:MAG: type II secretion system F family protein [Dehalococcoidia bacterium]
MTYTYIAVTPSGERIEGRLDALTEDAAERLLWDSGYRVIRLRTAWQPPRLDAVLPSIFAVKPQEIVTFARQMATLIESGIAVLPALELLQRQARPTLGRVLDEMAQAIRSGDSFSDALAAHPTVFPPIVGRLIVVGERTGNLELLLRQVATHIEKEQAIIKKVRGAMAYPAFTIVVAIVVVSILVTTALPPLTSLFDEFDTELPLSTKMLIAISNFASAYKMHMLAAVALATLGTALYLRTPSGRQRLDYVLLYAPAIGGITLLSNASRFARTLGLLLRAGVPLSEVMDLVINTTSNSIIKDGLGAVRDDLLAGEGLSAPLARTKLFPPLLVQMVEVGEETGSLDTNLNTMADFYEGEVDDRINALTSMIQPALTLIVGAVVAFIAVSIIMPMYSIMQSIH